MPQGKTTPLNQVLLQAPGVVQDSFGQLHVRGDHANLQYRINGVIIPEAITGFGQTLDTALARKHEAADRRAAGAIRPRTAGVVDIQTKSGGPATAAASADLAARYGTGIQFSTVAARGRWS